MRPAHPLEDAVGMRFYVSDADGVGGRLRAESADFRVRELEAFDADPLDSDPGSYPHLVLRATLHGWDTNDFAGALSDAMAISRERISWAGTKDKRAITTQLFTIRDGSPEDLPDLSGAEIEVLGRAGRAIHFGDLAGNEFEIVVSEPEHPDLAATITDELAVFGGTSAAERGGGSSGDKSDEESSGGESDEESADGEGEVTVGVPNFFGQQRFGSRRPVTHEVGLAVVAGRWEEAVMAYVGNPFDAEPEDTQEARAFAEKTRDWQAALERYPRRLGYERAMLHSLAESGGTEPPHFRDALETVPTNLQRLFVNAAQSYAFNRILSERLERGLPFDRAVAGDVVCFADREAPGGLYAPDPGRLQTVTDRRIDSVNRHCERGRAFVTAPLVGVETELSEGEPGEIERAVLSNLGIEPSDFNLPGEFHSTGTRRAVLVQTDMEVGRDPLRFSFALPSGCYATVLLREYLKASPLEMG